MSLFYSEFPLSHENPMDITDLSCLFILFSLNLGTLSVPWGTDAAQQRFAVEGLLCMSSNTVVLQSVQGTILVLVQVNSVYLMLSAHTGFTGHALERSILYNTSSCQLPSCWLYTNSEKVSKVLFLTPISESFLYPKTSRLKNPYLDVGQHCACGTTEFLSMTLSVCRTCAYIKVTT